MQRKLIVLSALSVLVFLSGGCGAIYGEDELTLSTPVPTYTPAPELALNVLASIDDGSEVEAATPQAAAVAATSTTAPTETPTSTPTETPTAAPTDTSVPAPTNTPLPDPTATDTPVPNPTDTPAPTATNTPMPEPTALPTDTAEPTAASPVADQTATTLAELSEDAIYAGLPENMAALLPDQGDPVQGEQETITNGCIACHSMEEGVVQVGPSWYEVGNHAVVRVEDQSPALYLYTSIIQPNAHVVEGFQPNLMPPNYADLLSDEQLADIIAYMLTLRGSE